MTINSIISEKHIDSTEEQSPINWVCILTVFRKKGFVCVGFFLNIKESWVDQIVAYFFLVKW